MDKIERRIMDLIDQYRSEIIEAGRFIWHHAELGYKEIETASFFEKSIRPFCDKVEMGHAITGVKGYLKEKQEEELTVCLMGEMAGIIGAAMALNDSIVKESLGGNVVFFAVPAEEYVEIEFKKQLMKEGKIKYGGGKCELIELGALDDINITVGHHILPGCGIRVANEGYNGFVCKTVRYTGIASHAAECPEKGVDALAAANLALHAIDLQRESFRDQDAVRIHGFISDGGNAMNVIADTVIMEHSVRANNVAAILDASEKFDRAIRAGAIATGCASECTTLPGYLPFRSIKDPFVLCEAIKTVGEEYAGYSIDLSHTSPAIASSTDFGDVSALMPVLQFNTGGYSGNLHNNNIKVVDEELAYVVTAKVFALCAYRLLKDEAEAARQLISDFEPVFTREEYQQYMESMKKRENIDMKPLFL